MCFELWNDVTPLISPLPASVCRPGDFRFQDGLAFWECIPEH
jgi:hypothetical protein